MKRSAPNFAPLGKQNNNLLGDKQLPEDAPNRLEVKNTTNESFDYPLMRKEDLINNPNCVSQKLEKINMSTFGCSN